MSAAMRRGLISREQISRGAPSGFGLEIHVSQRLTVVVADDKAALVVFLDVPQQTYTQPAKADPAKRPSISQPPPFAAIADVANGGAMFFGDLVDLFGELLAPLFG